MKTLPACAEEWLRLSSFLVKTGVVFVCPTLFAYQFCLRRLGFMAIDAWEETHELVAYVTIAYFVAFGCLVAVGTAELLWGRRKQAISDFAFAGLALFLTGFILAPMGAMPG